MEVDRTLLAQAEQQLRAAGVDSAQNDALRLMEYAKTTNQFTELLVQRVRRVPLQHLIGQAHFRYLTLQVGPGVFVPRPETELLTQVAIDFTQDFISNRLAKAEIKSDVRKPVVFDLCAGSGAVALSIATEVANVSVHAVELSHDALGWLLTNVDRWSESCEQKNSRVAVHALDAGEVEKFADWFNKVDVVVSNPPYIPNNMIPRDPEVRDHDPHLALFGGTDGLEIPTAVAGTAAQLLVSGGCFAMEHADTQGEGDNGLPEVLRNMVDKNGDPLWLEVTDHLDYNNLPRFTTAIRAERKS
ncbi:MAG: peptide chain release factor N(5)-glutamine methyltransferase [Actinobacteria bacterium]|nr:peptide chain release factor N(5)-glutamine methyltransferase [Actinomycetota bacterium]NBY15675.1 peptide chain release factor N(5)-glutamine methyltransferase [Actinomycetota bacterium]